MSINGQVRKIVAEDINFGIEQVNIQKADGTNIVANQVNAGQIPTSDGRNIDNIIKGVGYSIDEFDGLPDAVFKIGSKEATIVIHKPVELNQDLTVPENICLKFLNGGKIIVNTGYTLTINGAIDAGLWQIFDGDGTVAGNPIIKTVYPEWFGAKGDGVTDDSGAIQKALQFNVVTFSSKIYYIANVVRANIQDNVYVFGNGAKLIIKSYLYDAVRFGLKIVDSNGYDTVTSPNNNNIYIEDLTVEAETEDTTSVLLSMYAYKNVFVKNCSFLGFKVEGLLIGTGCENVVISNCFFKETSSTYESKGLTIIQYSPDYQFYGIDTETWDYLTRPSTQVKNITVDGCIFERTRIQVSNVQHIKIVNCDFKKSATRGINLSPWVFDFEISNCSFTTRDDGVKASTCINVAHACRNGIISRNVFTDTPILARCINTYYGVENVIISGNLFRTAGSDRTITLSVKSKNIKITDNVFYDDKLGESIRINSLNFYDADKSYGNSTDSNDVTQNITILNNEFKGRYGRYVLICAEKNSNGVDLPIHNVIIENNCFYYVDGYLPSNGDNFISLVGDSIHSRIFIGGNKTVIKPSSTIFKKDIFIESTSVLENANIQKKEAVYRVDVNAGTITETLIGGDPEITSYVAIIGSNTLRIGGRYRTYYVPIVENFIFKPYNQISDYIILPGTSNDADYQFKDSSGNLIDLYTSTFSFYYKLIMVNP